VTGLDQIAPETIAPLALGAGILGTGGGGDPYPNSLELRALLQTHPPVPVVGLAELPDDAVVVSVGGFGAPTVSFEKVGRGPATVRAVRALERVTGRTVTHIVPAEIGGGNALLPVSVAALAGLSVIDADGMGRAFPEAQMNTWCIAGLELTPAAFGDAHGNVTVVATADSPTSLERIARAAVVAMGASSGSAFPVMTGEECRYAAVPDSMTLALHIGEAVLAARAAHEDPAAAAAEVSGGRVLAEGKVVDVNRQTTGGFARGSVSLLTADGDIVVDFQNELLVARAGSEVLACVPDLISILERETGSAISTEHLRYGQRVSLLGIPAPAVLRTEAALAIVGPAAFGFTEDPAPIPGVYGGSRRR
jgi:uncharacterized protein